MNIFFDYPLFMRYNLCILLVYITFVTHTAVIVHIKCGDQVEQNGQKIKKNNKKIKNI